MFNFLAWLDDSINRALATVLVHFAFLADSLRYGLDLHIPERVLSLGLKCIIAAREPRH